MNVWKYTYIKFYKFRRWGLGKTLGEGYAAMLFVASFDVLLYFGILILSINLWIKYYQKNTNHCISHFIC